MGMTRETTELCDAPAEYDLRSARQAPPVGFKQTEVGAIPEDWDETTVGALEPFVTSGSRGWAKYYSEYGDLFVRITNMSRESIALDLSDARFVSLVNAGQEGRRTGLNEGDVLVSITADIGIVSYVDKSIPLPSYINQHIALVRFPRGAVVPRFVALFLAVGHGQKRFRAITDQGAKAGINLETVRSLPLALPRTLEEQRAIAIALSDVDALLEKLDRLIDKKRDIKQAAMQQLLTGQARLPGFEGEWSEIDIGRSSTLKARIGWQGLTTDEYLETGDYGLVTGTDFFEGGVLWKTCSFVSRSRYEQDKNIQLQEHDVLLTKDGTIGKAAYVSELPFPATLNSGVFVIRPVGESYVPKFLYYVLRSQVFNDFLNKLQAGSTIVHLYQKDFTDFRFLAPFELAEQEAIVEVLTAMEEEIEGLEIRREKTTAVKKSMMQELLTGRTRLL